MRPVFLSLLAAVSAFGQPFSFGVKGGVPLTDFLNTVSNQSFVFKSTTNRYIVGPTAELRLPFGLGIEVDALYRHFQYTGAGSILGLATTSLTTSGDWEFPLLVKYRFPAKIGRPYVDGGVAFDTLMGLTQTVTQTAKSIITSTPAQLNKSTTQGFVLGGGIDIHLLVLHLSPEIRYTRWNSQHFVDPNGLLNSNKNQAEVLVGITF